jgi:hypothetical protein
MEELSMANEIGWVLVKYVEPGHNIRYLTVDLIGLFDWSADHLKALRLARREDGNALSAIIEDAEAVEEHSWSCIRARCSPPQLTPADVPSMSRPMVKGDLIAGQAYTLQRSWDLRDGVYVVTLAEHQLSRQRRIAELRGTANSGEVEFPCGHTVAHEEGCPRCEIDRLRSTPSGEFKP